VIGQVQGGQYNGWNDSTQNFAAANAIPGPNHLDSFTVSANGVTTAYIAPGDPHSDSAVDALANYHSSILDPTAGMNGTALPTLRSAQTVTLTVADNVFVDNWRGESLSVTPEASATPEPATFGILGMAFAGYSACCARCSPSNLGRYL
jgi:hypothetical protein